MHRFEANGASIPVLGLGTWQVTGRVCVRIVEQALRLGYRHIDTAQTYDNEREVGEGLRASGVKRQEVFVTTKIAPGNFSPRLLERSVKESLMRLRLSDVDLLLLHWPNPEIPLSETMAALCKVKKVGFARHIGVSNFTVALLEAAVALSSEPLVTNQIECHPHLDQSKVIDACRRHGLCVTAYSPIARGRMATDETLAEIGRAYGKTAAQVSLRHLVQEGHVVLPRTARVERLSENLDIFDFALSEHDMARVRTLARPDGRVVNTPFSPRWD